MDNKYLRPVCKKNGLHRLEYTMSKKRFIFNVVKWTLKEGKGSKNDLGTIPVRYLNIHTTF